MESKSLIGILVVYYEDYLDAALEEFSSILSRISKDNVVVVVSTNEDLRLGKMPENFTFIYGNNSLREFSGWESGLVYCRNKGLINSNSLVVFANDTFCHHNKFGFLTRLRFVSAFKKTARKAEAPILVGEIHELGHLFSIGDVKSGFWVCTYLFALTGSLIMRMGSLIPEDNLASIRFGYTQENFITGEVSSNLASHICRWLLGEGPTTWYGKEKLTSENRESLIGKAKSILCEKYLTARALATGATVISVFSNPLYRQLRRLESLTRRGRNP